MRYAHIASVAACAPERIIPNSYFNELLGEDVDTWLRENVEIYERRWCAPDESTADLCERASLLALERAGLDASALDLIILALGTKTSQMDGVSGDPRRSTAEIGQWGVHAIVDTTVAAIREAIRTRLVR